MRSETVRLWEPVLVIYGPGPFSFEGEQQGVDVVTAAVTSVRNAIQKPETVYDLRRLLLTSRPWFERPGHLPTIRRTITRPFWMN